MRWLSWTMHVEMAAFLLSVLAAFASLFFPALRPYGLALVAIWLIFTAINRIRSQLARRRWDREHP